MVLGSWYVGPVPTVVSEGLKNVQLAHLLNLFQNEQTLQHVILPLKV